MLGAGLPVASSISEPPHDRFIHPFEVEFEIGSDQPELKSSVKKT
jgi:hypothetical protein